MRGRVGAGALTAVFFAIGFLAPRAEAETHLDAVERGAAYLDGRRTSNGAFFVSDAPPDLVAEVLASLAVSGDRRDARQSMAFLSDQGPKRAKTKAAYAGRLVMGIVAAGSDPTSLGGFDYVATLESSYTETTGAYDSSTVYADALALLGVSAVRHSPPEPALAYLKGHQCPGGGFSWAPGCTRPADTDTTAVALMALIASGVTMDDPAVSQARFFLNSTQRTDGGFALDPHLPNDPTNANSTGLVLSAIAALGEDPASGEWTRYGRGPVAALLSLQDPSGGFRHRASDASANDYATVQALPGLAGRALPVMRWKGPRSDPFISGESQEKQVLPTQAPGTLPSRSTQVEGGGPVEREEPAHARSAPSPRALPTEKSSGLGLIGIGSLVLLLPLARLVTVLLRKKPREKSSQ